MILPSSLKAGLSFDSDSMFESARMPWSVWRVSPFDLEGNDLALETTLLGRAGGELVGADADLVELGAGDLPLVGDHLGRDPLVDQVEALVERLGEGEAVLLHDAEAVGEGDVPHVLDAAADGDVVDAGGDQGRGEVDALLGGAALTVDRGRGDLDRQPGLEPGVATDVHSLLAELLDAAADDVADLVGIDPGAIEERAVDRRQQRRGMDVLVVALLRVPAADGQPCRLDDDDLAPAEVPVFVAHLIEPSLCLTEVLVRPRGRDGDDRPLAARPVE